MKTKTINELMCDVEILSESIHLKLLARSDNLDDILKDMESRDECLTALIPGIPIEQKQKWILVLSMIRDKEAAALMPYREDLRQVENSLIAINKFNS